MASSHSVQVVPVYRVCHVAWPTEVSIGSDRLLVDIMHAE